MEFNVSVFVICVEERDTAESRKLAMKKSIQSIMMIRRMRTHPELPVLCSKLFHLV